MITVNCKTKANATLKLYNQLVSYLFEQEYEDLRGCSSSDIDTLKRAKEVLCNIIKKHSK